MDKRKYAKPKVRDVVISRGENAIMHQDEPYEGEACGAC